MLVSMWPNIDIEIQIYVLCVLLSFVKLADVSYLFYAMDLIPVIWAQPVALSSDPKFRCLIYEPFNDCMANISSE